MRKRKDWLPARNNRDHCAIRLPVPVDQTEEYDEEEEARAVKGYVVGDQQY